MLLDAESAHSIPKVAPLASLRPAPTIAPPLIVNLDRIEVPIEQITFWAAHGVTDLSRIAHLRDEIALAPHVRAAPTFTQLEKKETKLGSSAHSSGSEKLSAQFASCR